MDDKYKGNVDLGLLEEDDEFEEFPTEGNLKWFFVWSVIYFLFSYRLGWTKRQWGWAECVGG